MILTALTLVPIYPIQAAEQEEEATRVKVTGEVAYTDISPTEASRRALEDARRRAIAKVVGVSVRSEEVGATFEEPEGIREFFSRVSRTSYQGRIVREEVLDWSEEVMHPHGDRSPPINIRKVELEAWVVIEEGRPDPSFQVETKANRTLLRSGESLELSISCTMDCYVTVLNLTADDRVAVLFPNRFEPDARLEAGAVRRVPEAGAHYRLSVQTLPGHSKNVEWTKVIATRDPFPISLIASAGQGEDRRLDIASLNRLLLSVPVDRRTESSLSYSVLAPTSGSFAPADPASNVGKATAVLGNEPRHSAPGGGGR